MSGRHPFRELTKDFTPERRKRVDAIKDELLAEMPLHELRRARALTQQNLAETLHVSQPAVAKLEQRADIYVSSLRSYIEAVGGRLLIVAEFPEGDVAITNFSQVGDEEGTRSVTPSDPAQAQPSHLKGVPRSAEPCRFEDAARRVAASTVKIGTGGKAGTAFYVGDGEFVTARQVVEGQASAAVLNSDYHGVAHVVGHGSGRAADVSLLALKGPPPPFAPLEWRQDELEPGTTVGFAEYALGFGDHVSVIPGVMSNKTEQDGIWVIETDARISLESSGGPLFDGCGRIAGVAGVNRVSEARDGVDFAVGQPSLSQLLEDIRAGAAATAPVEGSSVGETREVRAGPAATLSVEASHCGIQALGTTDIVCTVTDNEGWPVPGARVSAHVAEGRGHMEGNSERETNASGQAVFSYRGPKEVGAAVVTVRIAKMVAAVEVEVVGPPASVEYDAPEAMERLEVMMCHYVVTDDEGRRVEDADATVNLLAGDGLLEHGHRWFTYHAPAVGERAAFEIGVAGLREIVSVIVT